MTKMGKNSSPIRCLVWANAILQQCAINHFAEFGIMYVMHVRKEVMCNVVIESAKNEVCHPAVWIHVIGAFYLIHDPGCFYESIVGC